MSQNSRGPSIRHGSDMNNFVIETKDGEVIEAAGMEISWRTDFITIWPADPDAIQRSLKNEDVARIGLTNPHQDEEHTRVVPYWFTPEENND